MEPKGGRKKSSAKKVASKSPSDDATSSTQKSEERDNTQTNTPEMKTRNPSSTGADTSSATQEQPEAPKTSELISLVAGMQGINQEVRNIEKNKIKHPAPELQTFHPSGGGTTLTPGPSALPPTPAARSKDPFKKLPPQPNEGRDEAETPTSTPTPQTPPPKTPSDNKTPASVPSDLRAVYDLQTGSPDIGTLSKPEKKTWYIPPLESPSDRAASDSSPSNGGSDLPGLFSSMILSKDQGTLSPQTWGRQPKAPSESPSSEGAASITYSHLTDTSYGENKIYQDQGKLSPRAPSYQQSPSSGGGSAGSRYSRITETMYEETKIGKDPGSTVPSTFGPPRHLIAHQQPLQAEAANSFSRVPRFKKKFEGRTLEEELAAATEEGDWEDEEGGKGTDTPLADPLKAPSGTFMLPGTASFAPGEAREALVSSTGLSTASSLDVPGFGPTLAGISLGAQGQQESIGSGVSPSNAQGGGQGGNKITSAGQGALNPHSRGAGHTGRVAAPGSGPEPGDDSSDSDDDKKKGLPRSPKDCEDLHESSSESDDNKPAPKTPLKKTSTEQPPVPRTSRFTNPDEHTSSDDEDSFELRKTRHKRFSFEAGSSDHLKPDLLLAQRRLHVTNLDSPEKSSTNEEIVKDAPPEHRATRSDPVEYASTSGSQEWPPTHDPFKQYTPPRYDPNAPAEIKKLPPPKLYQEPPPPLGHDGIFAPPQPRPASHPEGTPGNPWGSVLGQDPPPAWSDNWVDAQEAARRELERLEREEGLGTELGTRRQLELERKREELQMRLATTSREPPASIERWREMATDDEWKDTMIVEVGNAAVDEALEAGSLQTAEIFEATMEIDRLTLQNQELTDAASGVLGDGFLTSDQANALCSERDARELKLQDEITSLETLKSDYLSQKLWAESKLEKKSKQIVQLQAELRIERERLRDATAARLATEEKLDECTTAHVTKQSKLDAQMRELGKLKEDLKAANEEMGLMQKIYREIRPGTSETQLREDLGKALRQINSLESSNKTLANVAINNGHNVREHEARIKELETETRHCEAVKEGLQNELNDARLTIRQNEEVIDAVISNEDKDTQRILNQFQREVISVGKENENLRSEIKMLRRGAKDTNLPREVAELQQKLIEVTSERDAFQIATAQYSPAFRSMNRLEKENETLKRQLAAQNPQQITELKDQIAVLQATSGGSAVPLPAELTELKETLDGLRQQRRTLQDELRRTQKVHVADDEEKDARTAEIISALEDKIIELENEKDTVQVELETVKEINNQTTENYGLIVKKLDEVNRVSKSHQQDYRLQNQQLQNETSHFRQQNKEKEKVIRNLKEVINGKMLESFDLMRDEFADGAPTWIPPLNQQIVDQPSNNEVLEPKTSAASIDLGIARIQIGLFKLVEVRALHGMQDNDAEHVLGIAQEVVEDATAMAQGGEIASQGELRKQDEALNLRSLAKTYFWFALARYYADDTEGALATFMDANTQDALPAFELRLLEGWLERAGSYGPAREASAYGGFDGPTLQEVKEMEEIRKRLRVEERRHAREFETWENAQKIKKDLKKARAELRKERRKARKQNKSSKVKEKKGKAESPTVERDISGTGKERETETEATGHPESPKQLAESEGKPFFKWFPVQVIKRKLFSTTSQRQEEAIPASPSVEGTVTPTQNADKTVKDLKATIVELGLQVHKLQITDEAHGIAITQLKQALKDKEAQLTAYRLSTETEGEQQANKAIARLHAKIAALEGELENLRGN